MTSILMSMDRGYQLEQQRKAKPINDLAEEWQEEATQAALDGNPKRAKYIEHMKERLLRGELGSGKVYTDEFVLMEALNELSRHDPMVRGEAPDGTV